MCRYCGNRNTEGEHRCRRCGRKPGDTLTGELTLHQTQGALAAQLAVQAYAPEPQAPVGLRAVPNLARAVQRPLFQDQPASNVTPIDSHSPTPHPAAKPAPKSQKPQARRRSRVPEEQGSLDFLPPATARPRTLGTTVEAMIFCEESVASNRHRAVAASFDWGLVAIGYVLFLGAFFLVGGSIPFGNLVGMAVFLAPLPLFGLLYGLLYSLAGTETQGMKWAKLRLTTFEGFRPDRRERLMRFAGSCLSLCTVVGLVWSLADEEGLGWQDHISRTFPTPRRADWEIFHVR